MDDAFDETNLVQSLYHVVKFHDTQDNLLSGLHCVPESWIKWQNEWPTVFLTYPNEPKEVIRERVKNYESPCIYWFPFLATIMYSTDSYDSAMHYINKRKDSVEKFFMKVESPQSSISTNLSLSHGMNSSNRSEFEGRIHGDLSHDDPQSRVSKRQIDQNVDLDPFLTSVALRTSLDLLQGNNLNKAATSPRINEKWTLKHWQYLPGLVELLPNTGVYIGEAELENCLTHSKTYFTLTRQLTKHIFTDFALKTCLHPGTRRGNPYCRLDPDAVTSIVNFVRIHEYQRNSRQLGARTIKRSIRDEMIKCRTYS